MSPLLPAVVAALLTAAALPAQCSVQQQQQQQQDQRGQQVAAGLHITPNELWQLVDRAVAAAIQPLTIKLDSRIDTLDSRLDALDSRLDVLDARVDRLVEEQHRFGSDLAAGKSKSDEQDSKLQVIEAQFSDNKLQLHEQQARLRNQELLLNVTTSELRNLESRFAERALHLEEQDSLIMGHGSKIDSHESRLDSQTSQVNLHESSIGEHASRIAELNSSLETLQNRTGSHQARIDGITIRLNAVQNASADGDSVARDCSDLPAGSQSGIYLLQPGLGAVGEAPAYCDLDTDGGRWTVIQRRADIEPREDFYQRWAAYKEGFGELDKEFWWGLNNLWLTTRSRDRRYELRINMEDFDGEKRHAVYDGFRISSEEDGYQLRAASYSGDAGDSLRIHIGQRFTTKDKDQDTHSSINCATHKHSQAGWWYKSCYDSNLNGKYLTGYHVNEGGMSWKHWKGHHYSLKSVEMKIRPVTDFKA